MVQLGLNPIQVLDEMKMYEILPLIENAYLKNKEEWEMTRMQSYITASTQCKINKSMSEFLPFWWEKEREEVVIDKAEVEKLKQEIKQSEYILNGRIKKQDNT